MKIFEKLKRQKNLTTLVLLFLFGLLSAYIYNITVKNSVDLQSVPITSAYLKEGSVIEEKDISFQEIPSAAITADVILNQEELLGKVIDYGNALAKGSLFYSELLSDKQEVKDVGLFELEEGQIATTLEITEKTSYSNSLRVGHRVDLFFSGTGVENAGEKEKVIYGELVKQAKVLAIYGNDESENGYGENRKPSYLVVALSYEDADLVGRAKVFGEVFPVISYDALHKVSNPEQYYDSNRMKDAIYQRTIDIQLYPMIEETADEG